VQRATLPLALVTFRSEYGDVDYGVVMASAAPGDHRTASRLPVRPTIHHRRHQQYRTERLT
jgi:hypothetical protein